MITLKNLSANRELDRNAMRGVRGGSMKDYAPPMPGITSSIETDYDYTEKWNLQDSLTLQTNNLFQDGSKTQFAEGKGNLNVAGGSFIFGLQSNDSRTLNG